MERSASERDLPAVTGEVIFEFTRDVLSKKRIKGLVRMSIERKVEEILDPPTWASYLVIFSPGKSREEIRCQIDAETDTGQTGFAVGFGNDPERAFQDAFERMQWRERDAPMRISV